MEQNQFFQHDRCRSFDLEQCWSFQPRNLSRRQQDPSEGRGSTGWTTSLPETSPSPRLHFNRSCTRPWTVNSTSIVTSAVIGNEEEDKTEDTFNLVLSPATYGCTIIETLAEPGTNTVGCSVSHPATSSLESSLPLQTKVESPTTATTAAASDTSSDAWLREVKEQIWVIKEKIIHTQQSFTTSLQLRVRTSRFRVACMRVCVYLWRAQVAVSCTV